MITSREFIELLAKHGSEAYINDEHTNSVVLDGSFDVDAIVSQLNLRDLSNVDINARAKRNAEKRSA